MKILFDYKIFFQQKLGGISNYFYNLGTELIKKKINIKFSCPLHKNVYLNQFLKKYVSGFYVKKLPPFSKYLIENFNSFFNNKFLEIYNPDIVHETYFSNKNYNTKKKVICTVYDMINEKFPDFFNNSQEISLIKKNSILRADHILCISQKTKRDLMEIFDIKEKKISVTLLASTITSVTLLACTITNDVKQNSNLLTLKNYLLFVGSRYGYKNFEGFIKAYSSSSFLKNNFKIIAFGGEKFGKIDFEILKKNNLKNENVIFLNDNNSNLVDLYKSASALIYPSLYEGFGLPVLEAMEMGCPVISSNGGSLPEVGGSKLKYFNPNKIDSIINVLEQVLNSQETMQELIQYGFKRSREFSWSKCASETIDAYNKVL
jgi:glycosyltransferase involved in cell wall biosynthesis